MKPITFWEAVKTLFTVLPSPAVAATTYAIGARLTPLHFWKDIALSVLVVPPALVGAAVAYLLPYSTVSNKRRVYVLVLALACLLGAILFYEWYTTDSPRDAVFDFYVYFSAVLYGFIYFVLGYTIMLAILTILKSTKSTPPATP